MADQGETTKKEETAEKKPSSQTENTGEETTTEEPNITKEQEEGTDIEEDTMKEDENNEGGGKKSFSRDARRGNRRHTPYSKGRAVYHQKDQDSDPSCRVYVGNLSWDVSWRDLKDWMQSTGCEVSRADVLASPDGRSKGCGIVEFATAEMAEKAVETLNDTELKGRAIFVREDRESNSSSGYYTQQTEGESAPSPSASPAEADSCASGGESQGRRVYVGNLSWDVAWQDLKDHMRQAGEVSFAEVMNESDGRSKGCGIVEFATAEEAKDAIETLTDSELKGRMIFVREDRESTSSGGGGNFQSGSKEGSTSVFVGNLSYETSWQDLKDHMRQAGNVDEANVLSMDDGRSKGCGIVQYQRAQDADRAVRELQNSILQGRPIFCREDREQPGAAPSRGRGGRGGGGRSGGRGGRGGRGGGGRGGRGSNSGGGSQLFVGNLSADTTWKDLKDHFRQCGDVERAEVVEGKRSTFGTIRFFKEKDALDAISNLDGVEFQGHELEVRNDNRAN
uniref:RRM domain-containing protein n=1 Tax=Eucampia antarctica TaxID=49252 RepID=A0A7S2W0R0_9STRA|mmetsp:Transcript_1733/g.1644  ORF Transcript_1733/g.1644 Transcript_1733/m.1644 type:complete len:508 (+) Transcript_1733:52-1575(+)|eukprot:CAMPEP_0197843136 /NCGR_PEP_ID=MMETSP1437-20131217/47139_1 /TAXON_ID=49252 ORGANISM="Eucampia antarctica, Strain CCMP1452" /NCGR_SAMPLE_ID=MMETSP1437 /ASSEMBLY_ACC=CAM_ASM_001096 /LENGTH=507 /DNA_ID=CAMNT_0043453119 /DNA_START=52 /DNA_END=1575 /DNA_ORIENTATION=+